MQRQFFPGQNLLQLYLRTQNIETNQNGDIPNELRTVSKDYTQMYIFALTNMHENEGSVGSTASPLSNRRSVHLDRCHSFEIPAEWGGSRAGSDLRHSGF